MRIILALIAFLLTVSEVSAQQDTLKFRVSLRDKGETTYSLQRPEEFLSRKAIERRLRQGLTVDSTDLPVCARYVEEIRRQGVRIVVAGKWDNFVTVSCNDTSLIDRVASLPFVCSVEQVWKAPAGAQSVPARRDSLKSDVKRDSEEGYGAAIDQLRLSNGDKLHQAGFRGEGITIAVTDAGFHNADVIEAMRNIRVVGKRDFVNPGADIFAEHAHGMMVLSCIGMNCPGVMIGTAPEASFWLLRSEDDASEHLVEQDYWAAAVEFADSVGVDVVNASLGYSVFDDPSKNYNYCDLDGQWALMSRQASRMADKGMVLVCSAGNSGMGAWKKITVPADADNVLTVGAVDKTGRLAPFSSVGDTADGRVKPDVVAVGLNACVMQADGQQGWANGTSFASPVMCGMVACLWQACPELTAKELIELVRESGDRAACPDNIYGYGVPDVWEAYNSYWEGKRKLGNVCQ